MTLTAREQGPLEWPEDTGSVKLGERGGGQGRASFWNCVGDSQMQGP